MHDSSKSEKKKKTKLKSGANIRIEEIGQKAT